MSNEIQSIKDVYVYGDLPTVTEHETAIRDIHYLIGYIDAIKDMEKNKSE